MSLILLLSILSGVLIFTVLMQPAKTDSLNTAFNGDEVHVTKVEKSLIKATFFVFYLILGILVYLKYTT